jgi:glutamate-ammonia-ligase adenylyltransferase
VHHLRGLINATEAGAQYADLAQACLQALYPQVVAQFATKHGPPPGRGAAVLGMGSLGVGRLGATSDLDLIVIYDAAGVDTSTGRRPLATRAYYARLTQALVTAVTALTSQGRLYEVDMRLRPSGTQGPVATSLASFESYQMSDAWLWEHLALTRARAVAGDGGLCADVEAVRARVLGRGYTPAQVLAEVAQMRARIAAAKTPDGPWDVKLGAGRLQDIELLAQAASLVARYPGRDLAAALQAGAGFGLFTPPEAQTLIETYDLCWQIQSVSKLLSDKALDLSALGEGGAAMLLRETGAISVDDLAQRLARASLRATQVINRVVGQTTEGAE